MIIAVDYDGTITDDVTNEIRQEALEYIPKLYDMGCQLVLWTARKEEAYNEAVGKLCECGLWAYFNATDIFEYGYTGKLIADVYLDDKAVIRDDFDWQEAFKYINIKIKRKGEHYDDSLLQVQNFKRRGEDCINTEGS